MRGEGNKRRTAAAFAGACLATLVAVATATATIGVYVNNFANREAAKQILSAGGTHCERQWNKKTQTFGVTVKRGPALCGYRPPVTSDGDQPDQILEAQARVTRRTPKSVRHDAYVGLSVRNSASAGYELRVFPKGKRFSVKRNPDNGAFPVNGTAGGIRGINERNTHPAPRDRKARQGVRQRPQDRRRDRSEPRATWVGASWRCWPAAPPTPSAT